MDTGKIVITKEIVQNFKEGHEDAFQTLYEYFNKKVYFYALNILNDNQLAEDAVQNTFLTAYQQREKLVHVEAFHVWIMKIAVGECDKIIRRQGPETSLDADVIDELFADNDNYGFIEEIIYQEIESFPVILRSVALLKYFEEFKETEISEILDIPLGTVKSRLARIRLKLQEELSKQDITPETYRASVKTLPVILTALYNGWFDLLPDSPIFSQQIANYLVKSTPLISKLKLPSLRNQLLKLTATAGIVTTGVIGVYHFTQPSEPPKDLNRKYVEVVIPAEIVSVNFNKNYTNKDLDINVILSNNNYDYFTINNEEITSVSTNGDYTVQLYYKDEIIDQAQFAVDNIDRNEPRLVKHTYTNKLASLTVSEPETAIASVVVYREGKIYQDFKLNYNKTLIQFSVEPLVYYEVHVTDLANNVLKIKVYEKNQ